MRIAAPAKVNLFLGVGGVLPDGYHEVTTVLHALELGDEVALEPAPVLGLSCEADLGVAPEANLAYRAAVAFGEAVGREPAVRITLSKAVPHGAGLGGGSSDAAAVIAGLAAMWGVPSGDERALRVAASLGADVPFFLAGSPAALMVGRGDVRELALAGAPGVPLVLVRPEACVPTAAAYRAFDAAPVSAGDPARVLAAMASGRPAELAAALANNLEAAARAVAPEVGEVAEWLSARTDALGALVAGSGSAVFALCEDDTVAERIAEDARARAWWARATRLGAHGVRPLID